MADIVPFLFPGDNFTCQANVALTGGVLCDIVGEPTNAGIGTPAGAGGSAPAPLDGTPLVGLPALGAKPTGVVMRDAAAGDLVPVFRAGVFPLIVGATPVAAGNQVMADANGNVVPFDAAAGHYAAGKAYSSAAAGATAMIRLYE